MRGKAERAGLVVAPLVLVALLVFFAARMLVSGPDEQEDSSAPVAKIEAGRQSFGRTPDYTLTDQHGRRFDSSQLKGKVQVVSFLFAACTAECPIIGRTLVLLEQKLRRDGLARGVQIVLFNVDPRGASPKEMRASWRGYGGDPTNPSVSYLTGTPQEIREVVRGGFHVYYKRVPAQGDEHQHHHGGYDIAHNDFVEIADSQGRITRIFNPGSTTTVDQLVKAVKAAMRS